MSCIQRVGAHANAPGFVEPSRLTAAACTLVSFEHATWTLVYLLTVRAQTTTEDFHFLPLALVTISQSFFETTRRHGSGARGQRTLPRPQPRAAPRRPMTIGSSSLHNRDFKTARDR